MYVNPTINGPVLLMGRSRLPHNAQEPLGKHVTVPHYVNANHMHDITTGQSVTGILHMINKTLLDWYSKKSLNEDKIRDLLKPPCLEGYVGKQRKNNY